MTRRGFTLIEVMMVTAIFSVLLLAVGTVIDSVSTELAVSVPETDLQTSSQRALGRIVEELTDASAGPVSVAPDGSWISFMVPVDLDASWGVDGEPNPDYLLHWGARLGGAETRGGLNVLLFVVSTDSNVSPVNESDVVQGGLNININTESDRDETDVFAMGHLVSIYDPDGSFPTMGGDETVRQMTGDWVAQVNVGADFGGDVDGDGNGDPLFSYNAANKTVDINLWGLRVIRRQRTPLLVNERTTVVLTNQ